jgi:hypothetical protein
LLSQSLKLKTVQRTYGRNKLKPSDRLYLRYTCDAFKIYFMMNRVLEIPCGRLNFDSQSKKVKADKSKGKLRLEIVPYVIYR